MTKPDHPVEDPIRQHGAEEQKRLGADTDRVAGTRAARGDRLRHRFRDDGRRGGQQGPGPRAGGQVVRGPLDSSLVRSAHRRGQQAICGDRPPLGPDGSRLDDHHVDPERGHLHPETVAERFQRVLRGVVPATERGVEPAAHRADVDDRSRALSSHRRKHESDQLDSPEEIDVELRARLVRGHVLDRAVRSVAGVVHQHIDPPRLGEDGLDPESTRLVVGHVHREHTDAVGCQRIESLCPPRGGIHREPQGRQPPGRRRTDA